MRRLTLKLLARRLAGQFASRFAGLLLAPLGALAPGLGRAETMTWVMRDFPPSSMPQQGQPSIGMADEFVKAIVQRWPEVEHRYLVANNRRILSMLESGEPACFTTALRVPERERQAYIADMLLVPPQMLITRRELLPRLPLNSQGEVRLPQLLADTRLSGVLQQDRSYGVTLDRMIQARPANARLSLSAGTARPLAMVALERADYSIDYDYSLAYEQFSDARLRDSELRSVPIEGNAQPLVAGIACPRTDWGRRMILRIDRLIAELAQDPQARSGLERWTTPQARRAYGRQVEDFYRRRAQPTPESAFASPSASAPASSLIH